MASINTGKVVVGGLAAGFVMNVIDFVSNMFIVGTRMQTELEAVNPMLWTNMNDPGKIPVFVVIDFVLGIALVWLYAAMRPRFGAGAGTAMKAGFYVWFVASLMWYFFVLMGITSYTTFAIGGAVALVNMLASAYVGGMLYKEEG
jgi:hypothetical protein